MTRLILSTVATDLERCVNGNIGNSLAINTLRKIHIHVIHPKGTSEF